MKPFLVFGAVLLLALTGCGAAQQADATFWAYIESRSATTCAPGATWADCDADLLKQSAGSERVLVARDVEQALCAPGDAWQACEVRAENLTETALGAKSAAAPSATPAPSASAKP